MFPTCDSSGLQAEAPAYPEAAETDSDLLPGERPPPAWSLGPCLLQHVLAGDDVLSAQLLGDGCLRAQGRGVLSGPRAGGPLSCHPAQAMGGQGASQGLVPSAWVVGTLSRPFSLGRVQGGSGSSRS